MSAEGQARSGLVLKSPREFELMRRAGALVAKVLADAREQTKPGVTTGALNRRAEEIIAEAGAKPLFKGQVSPRARFPFPAALCVSVNEEIVHGIPGNRVLRDGDVVSVDCGVKLNGYCADAAVTLAVGRVSPEARCLIDVTRGALELAVSEIAVGTRWSKIAGRMQRYVEKRNLAVVRDFVGHGIGRNLHEEPKIPNYWDDQRASEDFCLQEGMTLAIEPMVNLGTEKARATPDSWTVVTRDGKYSAHFEHTVAVTASGADVLTNAAGGAPS